MRPFVAFSMACLALAAGATVSRAQGLRAVRTIPGYVCMLLTPEDEALTKQDQLPPVFAQPSADAPLLGYPAAIVFVRSPLHQVGQFAEIVRFNGQTGWIDAHHLRPWHPMNGGNAKCYPSLMSDGSLGQTIH